MKRSPFVYSFTKKTAQMVFSVFYHLEIERKEALPDHGPAIILPKHQYWTDIPIVGLSFGSLLYFVAKSELFKYPLVRHYLSLGGAIPVDRKQSIRTLDSFKNLLSLLRAGERIVIFPEGTYFREIVGSGKVRLLQMILRFQKELNYRIPFIPVGIRYGKRMRWRRRVEICIGHPLYAEKESDATSLTHQVMEEISCLCRMPRQSNEFGVSTENTPNPELIALNYSKKGGKYAETSERSGTRKKEKKERGEKETARKGPSPLSRRVSESRGPEGSREEKT